MFKNGISFSKVNYVLLFIFLSFLVASAGLIFSQLETEDPIESEPYHSQYYSLEKKLCLYENIGRLGGWGQLPEMSIKDTIFPGERDSLISLLRIRLESENYYCGKKKDEPNLYDAQLVRAVKLFQTNNGLKNDGYIHKSILKIMNRSVHEKINQIQYNMERWKSFPSPEEDNYLLVNIPDFSMKVVENGKSILKMKVIIGRASRQTPEFSAELTYINFNPSWHVPSRILRNDILPQLVKDPSYLIRNNMSVYKNENGVSQEVPISSIDWEDASNGNFPYSIIQAPGSNNALGGVKFIFYNKHNVYMHDTPSRYLFDRDVRAFSSGCIRLFAAFDLAYYLLENDEDWPKERIDKASQGGKTVSAYLKKPVPVHICYHTTWMDDKGQLQFRNDIYKKDRGTLKN